MSVTDKSTESLGWMVYKVSPKEMQEEFLRQVDLETNLPLVTWKGQIGLLDGAPPEITLKYISQIYWMAQIEIYNQLPANELKKAESLLDDRAKLRLGVPVQKKKRPGWSYRTMR